MKRIQSRNTKVSPLDDKMKTCDNMADFWLTFSFRPLKQLKGLGNWVKRSSNFTDRGEVWDRVVVFPMRMLVAGRAFLQSAGGLLLVFFLPGTCRGSFVRSICVDIYVIFECVSCI